MDISDFQNEDILQNLKDAGCNSELITAFFELDKNSKTLDQIKLLSLYRNDLVNQLRTNQRKIDCLDFLIFNIRQKENRQ